MLGMATRRKYCVHRSNMAVENFAAHFSRPTYILKGLHLLPPALPSSMPQRAACLLLSLTGYNSVLEYLEHFLFFHNAYICVNSNVFNHIPPFSSEFE